MSDDPPLLWRRSCNNQSLRERYSDDAQQEELEPRDGDSQHYASGWPSPILTHPPPPAPSPAPSPAPTPPSRPQLIRFHPLGTRTVGFLIPPPPTEIDLEIVEGYWRNDETPLPLYEHPPVYTEPDEWVWVGVLGVNVNLGRFGPADVMDLIEVLTEYEEGLEDCEDGLFSDCSFDFDEWLFGVEGKGSEEDGEEDLGYGLDLSDGGENEMPVFHGYRTNTSTERLIAHGEPEGEIKKKETSGKKVLDWVWGKLKGLRRK